MGSIPIGSTNYNFIVYNIVQVERYDIAMKEYICECGRVFTTPNSFNGHKSHCVKHLEVTGRLHIREQVDATNGSKSGSKLKRACEDKKQAKLQQWLKEQHTCSTCGNVMTELWGSGKYCSRRCANSHPHSEETKARISIGLRTSPSILADSKRRHEEALTTYAVNPNRCCICEEIIPYEKRYRKTCSDKCESTLSSLNSKEAVIRHGGNLNQKGFKSHFQGNYKGFHCDSTWELAFIVYHLENNISFERNTEYFPYTYEGSEHNYFPDFIVDGVYYEVKGYHNDIVQAKIAQFPKDKKLVVLYYEQMKPMIDYCMERYGNRYWEALYE